MVGKVVVTYKRKRLFSRSDQSHLNSHSHVPSKNLESEEKLGFCRCENSVAEARLPDLDKELKVVHDDIDGGEEKHVNEVEHCNSQCSVQCPEQATKAQSEQGSHCPNMLLEGNTEEKKCISSSSSLTLKDGDNLHKVEDRCTNFRDDPSYKRRLMSPLITFYRRSKRMRRAGGPNDDTSELGTSDEVRSVAEHVIQAFQVVTSSVEEDVNKSDIISVTNRTPSDVSVATALHAIDCNQPPESSDQNILLVDVDFCHKILDSSSEVKEDFPCLQQQDTENRSLARSAVDKGKAVLDSRPTCLQLFPMSRSNNMLQTTYDAQKLSSPAVSQQAFLFPNLSLQPNHHAFRSSASYWRPDAPNHHTREPFKDFLQYTSDQSRQRMMLDNMFTIPRTAMGHTSSSFLDQVLHPYFPWLEDELDCLWIGVRRHGVGNWEAMLRDQRLRFFPWRTISDLAERWKKEQSRLVYGLSLDRVNHMIHSQARSQVDDSQLSIGDSYLRLSAWENRQIQMPASNPGTSLPYNTYMGKEIRPPRLFNPSKTGPVKEGLPHWLREAIETPPLLHDQSFSSTSHGKQRTINNTNSASTVPYLQQPWINDNVFASTHKSNESKNDGKAHHTNGPLVIRHGRVEAKRDEPPVNNQNDVIVLSSDASSEETISDDHR